MQVLALFYSTPLISPQIPCFSRLRAPFFVSTTEAVGYTVVNLETLAQEGERRGVSVVATRRTKAKPASRSIPTPQVEPPENPLISPHIIELSRTLTAAHVTSVEDGRNPSKWSFDRVPPALLPFIQDLKLETLTDVLDRDFLIYWHPIVMEQMLHLCCLMMDPRERISPEAFYNTWIPPGSTIPDPRKMLEVASAMKPLIEAHATNIFPMYRIEWKGRKKKSGCYPMIENPHRVGKARFIDAQTLYEDWGSLHAALKAQMQNDLWRRPRSSNIAKLRDQVMQVLSKADIAAWSDLRKFEPSSDAARVAPKGERGILNRRLPDEFRFRFNLPQPKWDNAIKKMIPVDGRNAMGRAGKEGKSAYLAYAILGILLDTTPKQIKDRIHAYKRPRSPASRRPLRTTKRRLPNK